MRVFPDSRYFCIDPLEENRPFLEKLTAKHPNVEYWLGCLGSFSGSIVLNVDGDGSSVLKGHWGNLYGTQRDVLIETLDNLVSSGVCPRPNLVKMDVQGYELEVLNGAAQTLESVDAVIVETSLFPFQSEMPIFHELLAELVKFDFVPYDILSLSLRPLDKAVAQSDLLLVRRDHALRSDHRWDHDSTY